MILSTLLNVACTCCNVMHGQCYSLVLFSLHVQYVVHVHVSVTLPCTCTLHVAIIMLPRELHVSSSPGSKLWGW